MSWAWHVVDRCSDRGILYSLIFVDFFVWLGLCQFGNGIIWTECMLVEHGHVQLRMYVSWLIGIGNYYALTALAFYYLISIIFNCFICYHFYGRFKLVFLRWLDESARPIPAAVVKNVFDREIQSCKNCDIEMSISKSTLLRMSEDSYVANGTIVWTVYE